ncbi:DUF1824 family protein [Synechococcus sp. CBW1107]|uniref:DUF1824 family protein n=1 Tax=Synechococcus sp. CBW1107 TaxID=2789857 RepID=UPI0018CF3239|nr:DUF1824 family protein [Synechococcus sp. CBW1107]QPN56409.1 DUF1824 family protein [Synechococcus sp. CBW1107]CAK6697658.1 hypothetical protein BBFGKLBO_02298 [Synechococcus sp. CBW1107]
MTSSTAAPSPSAGGDRRDGSDQPPVDLASLLGQRSAPSLDADQRQALARELKVRLAACDWFTIGVMAPSAQAAVAALRSCETALGWSPLQADSEALVEGPVFLKGNQRTGRYLLRAESGLGEGLLIGGQSDSHPEATGTWGPLPLDFFG